LGIIFINTIAAQMKMKQIGLLVLAILTMATTACKKKPREERKLVINKIRTKEELADSLASKMKLSKDVFRKILCNNDSLKKYGKDSLSIMSAVVPNTYRVYADATPSAVLKKILDYESVFWDKTRKDLASAKGLSVHEIVTLASIVEEETNLNDEKGKVASVYMNRLKKKMPLQADPTVKFAKGDFKIDRIYLKYIEETAASPYNTYKRLGLPPGPICTPSVKTIDAVLHAPNTDYIYFVAQPNLSGKSNFAKDYAEHLKYAGLYSKFIDSLQKAKKAKLQ
jgi:UPF0755 protein